MTALTAFQSILALAKSVQSIKNKYPMIVSYLKHLQKCEGDKIAEDKEVEAFRLWLLTNPNIPTIDNPYYKSSKQTICFSNVHSLAKEDVVADFEKNLGEIEHTIFPDGRPAPVEGAVAAEDLTPGVASAMAAIESNPVFSGLLDNIKNVVADTDVVNDPSSIMDNKNFKVLLKNIQNGIERGKYNLSDITSTIHTVIGSVKSELDDDMNNVMEEAVGMMSAAEQGQQPDVGRIMELLKTVNFNK